MRGMLEDTWPRRRRSRCSLLTQVPPQRAMIACARDSMQGLVSAMGVLDVRRWFEVEGRAGRAGGVAGDDSPAWVVTCGVVIEAGMRAW